VKVTQIFSGIFFAGLAVWLSFTNGTKLSFIQQASLEKRLTVCCFFGVYVGAVSAFFNFFQLTEVDDILLAREDSFVLDFSRPLEWILTCPLMQLVLVLMGGSRIPEYRRALMPGLSVLALCCATTSMLVSGIWVFVAYGVGVCVASTMFFLNRVQIIEHSEGQEGLLSGDSDFRKASVLLIVTWVPFPMFYAFSTEGLGVITDVVFIQVGWAFLNIVSKFTFIFYIQRIKDNYCSRMKAKRELAGVHTAPPPSATARGDGSVTPVASVRKNEKNQGEMGALVVETMSFLGMAQNSDRFLRLLSASNVHSLDELAMLSQAECAKRQLPWDLVAAVQKRLKVWRLEMQDTAEIALEQGEAHYQFADEDAARTPCSVPGAVATPTNTLHQMQQPLLGADDGRMQRMEDTLVMLQQQSEIQADMMRRFFEEQLAREASKEAATQRTIDMAVQAALRAQEQSLEGSLQQRLGEGVGELVERARGRLEQVADRVSDGLQAQAKELQVQEKELQATSDKVMGSMDHKIMSAVQQLGQHMVPLTAAVEDISRATDNTKLVAAELQGTLKSDQQELGRLVGRKLEDHSTKILEKQERSVEVLRSAMQHDMTTVISRTDMVGDVIRENGVVMKETLGDLRRLCIAVLDASNAGQDLSQQSLQRVAELRQVTEAVSSQIADGQRVIESRVEDLRGDPPSRPMSATQRDRDRELHSQVGQRPSRYSRGALGA